MKPFKWLVDTTQSLPRNEGAEKLHGDQQFPPQYKTKFLKKFESNLSKSIVDFEKLTIL